MLIFLIISSACINQTTINNKQILILGTSPDYPPYESINKNGNIIGYDIDIAKIIAQYMNKKLIIKQMSFDALILSLQNNKINMIISGMSSTKQRKKHISLIPYKNNIIQKYTLIFLNKIPNNIHKFQDLQTLHTPIISVQSGTDMANFLYNIPNIYINTLDSNHNVILDVLYKKSCAGLLDTQTAIHLKNKQHNFKLLTLNIPQKYQTTGYAIGINKHNKILYNDIKQILLKIKLNGILKKIETKWLTKITTYHEHK